MWRDPIVEEVRAERAMLAAEHGDDLATLLEALRQKQGADGRKVVTLSPKRDENQAHRKVG